MRALLLSVLVSFNLVACVAGDNEDDLLDEELPAGQVDQVDQLPELEIDSAFDRQPGDRDATIEQTSTRRDVTKQLPELQQQLPPQIEQDTALADPGEIDEQLQHELASGPAFEQDSPRAKLDRERPALR